ncbi:EF-hand domain-containing protein [Janthinobacterium sp. PSPC3-1]|uniref:EF-hand domain-containing protein n=1 Tax=Janthinobacterium sp. PSPC3-1 TaxID=2804653 RepID=UPI003CF37C47
MQHQKIKRGACASRLALVSMVAAMMAACTSASPPAAQQPATQQPTAAAGPAAPAGGHGLSAFIGGFDANRDGVVTRQEYDAVRTQRFTAADTNHDGVLSEDEYVAEFEGRLQQQYAGKAQDERYAGSIKQAHVRFKILDTDHDGKLTLAEENAIAGKTFQRTDTNGDGKIDQADGDKK